MTESSSKKLIQTLKVIGSVGVLAYAFGQLLFSRRTGKHRESLYERIALVVDQRIGWYRLPKVLGLAVLSGFRGILRLENLHDTSTPANSQPLPPPTDMQRRYRTHDGTYNDLKNPQMGAANTRFGRNVPLEYTQPHDVLTPSPREVSRKLMTRETIQEAKSLNLLAAAWIQFMVRDWLSHGSSDKENPWIIRLADDDKWHDKEMTILRTRADPTRIPSEAHLPPTFINTESHWWDGSQIYGSSKEFQIRVRTGRDGKLNVGRDDMVVIDNEVLAEQATLAGWWVGMALMFTLFTLEHNSICDRLRQAYPNWSDDDLFEHARLINAALMAKIHTVQWTPAIIAHPTTVAALRANWWGLAGEKLHRVFGRLSTSEVISGIPGGETDHFGVPYAITEEFVAVYRMHPLIPDDFVFRSAEDDRELEHPKFPALAGQFAQDVMHRVSLTDLFYSFGRMHPGAVRLHNYPNFLQDFERPDGRRIDLAAHDILRCRELGVPTYNEFRRLLHLNAPESIEAMTNDPQWAKEIREMYDGDVEAVDLIVGMFAEPLPEGFGFSDTAFRIFILMASRRLNSDRFFTEYFTPEIYSPEGMEWIENNDMSTILRRHYPRLAPALEGVSNPFAPWNSVQPAVGQ